MLFSLGSNSLGVFRSGGGLPDEAEELVSILHGFRRFNLSDLNIERGRLMRLNDEDDFDAIATLVERKRCGLVVAIGGFWGEGKMVEM